MVLEAGSGVGDVIFLKDNIETILIGFHTEKTGAFASSLAIRNKFFKRGPIKSGFRQVTVTYPPYETEGKRVYSFEFGLTEFKLTSHQMVITENVLSNIMTIPHL